MAKAMYYGSIASCTSAGVLLVASVILGVEEPVRFGVLLGFVTLALCTLGMLQ
jgi:hypothetical protein